MTHVALDRFSIQKKSSEMHCGKTCVVFSEERVHWLGSVGEHCTKREVIK